MGLRDVVYAAYERRLARSLARSGATVPRHVGVIVDGNRRWAKELGLEDPNHGHRVGARKIRDLLGWCDDAGVDLVTLWLLSTDNLSRPETELAPLLRIIETLVSDLSGPDGRWTIRIVGALDLLPAETTRVLKEAAAGTEGRSGVEVNVAVGYGGRRRHAAPAGSPPGGSRARRRHRSRTRCARSARAGTPTAAAPHSCG